MNQITTPEFLLFAKRAFVVGLGFLLILLTAVAVYAHDRKIKKRIADEAQADEEALALKDAPESEPERELTLLEKLKKIRSSDSSEYADFPYFLLRQIPGLIIVGGEETSGNEKFTGYWYYDPSNEYLNCLISLRQRRSYITGELFVVCTNNFTPTMNGVTCLSLKSVCTANLNDLEDPGELPASYAGRSSLEATHAAHVEYYEFITKIDAHRHCIDYYEFQKLANRYSLIQGHSVEKRRDIRRRKNSIRGVNLHCK